jgi:dTDP-4-amino-4,6-dideoxygalactose transaminase
MYTPLHLRTAGKEYAAGALPVTESIYQRAFNLPVRPGISEVQMAYIAKIVQHAILR